MAKNIETALGFLKDLAAQSIPLAKKQREELVELQKEITGTAEVKPWDDYYL